MDDIIENVEGLVSTNIVGVSLSEDKRYLTIREERTIDLQAVTLLSRQDEHIRQAYFISKIFSEYIDYRKHLELYRELTRLLNSGVIELLNDHQGKAIVNILKNTGQAQFVRLLITYMTPQKLTTIHDKQGFNTFKHLLMERMRHLSRTIDVNSISVTLKRAVNSM